VTWVLLAVFFRVFLYSMCICHVVNKSYLFIYLLTYLLVLVFVLVLWVVDTSLMAHITRVLLCPFLEIISGEVGCPDDLQ